MKKQLKQLAVLLGIALIWDMPRFVFAQSVLPPQGGIGNSSSGGTLKNPLGSTSTLPALLEKVLSAMIQLGVPIIILAYVYAGFKYVTAFGDSKKVGEATDAFKWTTVGAGVLLGAKALAMIIKGTIEQLK